MICILKAVVGWAVVSFIAINLVGLITRGLMWAPPPNDPSTDRVNKLLQRETARLSAASGFLTFGIIVIAAGLLFALLHFWNVGLASAAAIIGASRLPDLIWEIRTGKKVSRQDHPRGAVFVVGEISFWATLPLVWYSLCMV